MARILRVLLLTVAMCAMASGSVWAAIAKVVVVGLFSGKAVVDIDGKQRILKVGDTSPEGVKLIAASSREAVLEWDGQQRRMGLGNHIGGSYAAPKRTEVTLWPDERGMFHTVGSINGLTVNFLVDTGATSIAMNSGEARRLGIDYRVKGERGMASTASGVVPVYQVKLDTVKVGEIMLRNVSAVVIEGNKPDQVLLGMTFLGRLEMRREGEAMVLVPKW